MLLRKPPLSLWLLVALSVSLLGQISFTSQNAPALTPPQSKTPPDQKCSLQGRVSDALSGAPIKKATVSLQFISQKFSGTWSSQEEGYSTTSEADGSFTFTSIEPGEYNLSGSRTGYIRTQFGQKSLFQPGVVLSLKPIDKKNGLNLPLFPQGVISGKIIDADGDPMAQILVMALRPAWFNSKAQQLPVGSAQSNDLGEFRIPNLSPGKYNLLAQKISMFQAEAEPAAGKPDMRAVNTYYPAATTIEAASLVEVQPGQELSGMDIQLASVKTYHVRGAIAGDLGKADLSNLRVSASESGNPFFMFPGAGASVKKDRTFDLAGIAPGAHNLILTAMNGGFKRLALQPIEVGSADIEGITLQVVPLGTIRGQITVQGDPVPGVARVNPASLHPMLFADLVSAQVNVKDDGSLLIESVSPGTYRLNFRPPEGTYLKSVLFQKQDISGQELDLNQSVSGELDIILRYGPAEVAGTVRPSDDASASSATEVVLIPEVLGVDESGVETASADQNNSFSVKNLKPGKYRAVALASFDLMQLQNPDLLKQLQSLGQPVELKENEKKQISLERIPAADLHRVFAALGIDSR